MWAQIANTVLGVWLMCAPAVLDYGRPAATNDWIVGPLVAMFACIAIWESTRGVRWINVPLGVWLLVAPWVLGFETMPLANSTIAGALVSVLSFMRGSVQQKFGGGWVGLFKRQHA